MRQSQMVRKSEDRTSEFFSSEEVQELERDEKEKTVKGEEQSRKIIFGA